MGQKIEVSESNGNSFEITMDICFQDDALFLFHRPLLHLIINASRDNHIK